MAQTAKELLISEIYEVALKPELYGNFIDLWERQLADAIARLEEIDRCPTNEMLDQDPEIKTHFERAFQILERMGRSNVFPNTAEEFVTGKPGPALLLSSDGAITAANTSAQELLGAMNSIGQLRNILNKDDGQALEQILMRLDRPQYNPEILLLRVQINNQNSNQFAEKWFVAQPIKLDPKLQPMLYISALSVNWTDNLETLLEKTFALTKSEVEIIRDLSAGNTLNEIATIRTRSVHTIRAQIKSIFPKMNANSQTDLVRMVSTLAVYATEASSMAVPATQYLVSGTKTIVRLSDGRNIPVNQFGPENGKPVLFLHGMLDSFIFNQDLWNLFGKSNIRIIAPTRPGFGESPIAHNMETAPSDFVDDIAAILDHLEVQTCPVIGHMAGAIYAFAAAKQLGSRIERIINVAGGVPIISLKQFSSMSPRQRVVAWTARFTPSLLPTILRAGISQIDSGGHEAFMKALYPEDNADRNTSQHPDIAASIQAGYQFSVAQGHRAFEIDSRHVTRDWSEYVDNVNIPVTLIHGIQDPVVSIESVRAFAERYENISLSQYEDSGQLILYQRTNAVLDQLSGFNR